MKKFENVTAPSRNEQMFAPATVRMRKIENGISGSFARDSMTRNAIRSTTPRRARREHPAGAEAVARCVRDRVDEQRDAGGDGDGAGDVRRARPLVAALADVARREQEGDHADRDVDEEDPLPAEILGQTPPASTPTAAPEPPIAPQMPSALLRSAPSSKVVVMIESAAGEMIAAPKPWTARARDQHALGRGEPAGERRGREDDDADEEDAPPAEQVGGAAAEQQEAAEGDRVGGDDPLEVVAARS